MKRTSFFLLALTLLLTFAGCNQKEKKLAKIVEEPTDEQIHIIGNITKAAIGKDLDCYVNCTNDTFLLIGSYNFTKDDLNKANETKELQKKFLLSAFCSDSPELRDIMQKIADVPAVIQLSYEDTIRHQLFKLDINNVELREALSKKYKPTDALSSLLELENERAKPKGFTKLEVNYVVFGINTDSLISDLEELVEQDIADAKGSFLSNIDEILDLDKYKDKISESYTKEFQSYYKELLIEEHLLSGEDYLTKLMKRNDLGFIFRFYDPEMDKSMDIVFEKDEIDELIK